MLEVKKISRSHIRLSCNPDHIDDLLWLLDTLTTAAKRMRSAIKAKAAQLNADDPKEKEKRRLQYMARSDEAYRIYTESVQKGMSPALAIQHVKLSLNLGYEEAKIYITQGKRQDKERIKRAQLRLYCPD